jgi:hypothetical protein
MLKMTMEIAWAAAQDAGNRNMKTNGREKWDQSDFIAAGCIFDKLWPLPEPKKEGRLIP